MKKTFFLFAAVTLISACSSHSSSEECPKVSDMSPSLDAGWFADLSARLAGPDRANSISEAVANLHRTHPEMDSTMIEDVLIAADCPVVTRAGLSADGAKARIADLRGQVDQILKN